MAEDIQRADGRSEIERIADEAEMILAPVDLKDPGIFERAKKFPLGEISSLGTAFASMPESVRTVTTAAEGIYKVVLPHGAKGLKTLKSGRITGAFAKMKGGGSKVAELIPVDGIPQTVPYDPSTLFMAMALAEINRKLDTIQETQEEMFEYMRQKDDSVRRGNLNTLADILENYRFNWDNDIYKKNKHIQVQGIRQKAEQDTLFLKGQISSKLDKKGFVSLDADAEGKASDVLALLKDYQVAVYLYSFSSFLEVMLLGNFDRHYLDSVSSSVEKHSLEYRELYTLAYNSLEGQSKSTLQHHLLSGLSSASSFLGKAIESTPVGDLTQIDEALIGAGKMADTAKRNKVRTTLASLPHAKMVDIQPFVESIRNIDLLHNEPAELFVDGDAIYLLPESTAE